MNVREHRDAVRALVSKAPFSIGQASEKDLDVFCLALVHDSYLNEHPEWAGGSYERLEFLGDAVIELVVSEHLYSGSSDDEAVMTVKRSRLASNERISASVIEYGIDIDGTMLMGKGQAKNGDKPGVRADAFEALVGAAYVTHGLDKAASIVKKTLFDL
jgi:ribonuclease-3